MDPRPAPFVVDCDQLADMLDDERAIGRFEGALAMLVLAVAVAGLFFFTPPLI